MAILLIKVACFLDAYLITSFQIKVWQMRMPEELSRPVQRVLRTMMSGVILVQCFTVYVYLAAYIVLLYPVFLEERPTLVLPWLLLAAVRKLLCELMSLALGLGTCVLLGPARPPCIMFLIMKLTSITPAFYMWMIVFSYYHTLKMTSAFKTFPAVLPSNGHDYGLELAIRRRRTKSLQGEDQLRKKLIASLYGERSPSSIVLNAISNQNIELSHVTHTTKVSVEDVRANLDVLRLLSVTSNRTISDIGTYEDWFGNEVALPRDTDRILEQFGLMLLRIAAYLKEEGTDSVKLFNSSSHTTDKSNFLKCTAMPGEDTDTPPHIGSSKGRVASYLMDYPQIFMKKPSDLFHAPKSEHELIQIKDTATFKNFDENNNVKSIETQKFLSYEIKRISNTVEETLHDKHLQEQFSNNSTDKSQECNSNRSTKEKRVNNKAVNTTCRLKSQNKFLNINKTSGSDDDVKNGVDRIKTRIPPSSKLQKEVKKREHK